MAILLKLIPWIIAGLSLAGIGFLVARKIPILLKLPAVPPEGQEPVSFLRSFAEKVSLRLRGLRYSSYQPAFVGWLEKMLRRLRLVILKIDSVFVGWINGSRERSQIWTVRSRAWMEQHRLKKIQKLQVLEKLDQAEIIETIQKAKEDVKNDQAEEPKEPAAEKTFQPPVKIDEEKKLIDLIARDPRDVESYKKLGFLYCEQNNKEDAKNCFKQVLKLNPDDLEVVSKMRELVE